MASIKERGNKFCVIYHYKDSDGNRRQKWETYATKPEALERKKEVEYRGRKGIIAIPKCNTLKQLLKEYVTLYGKDAWAVTTYEKMSR